MYDTHLHTKPFSTDGEMVLAEVLMRKEETGLGIVLTEHMDYDFPPPAVYAFDADNYFKAYTPYRSDEVLLGVEIGLQQTVIDKNKKLVGSRPFDMVIGSIHAVCGKDLYDLSYYQSFPDKKSAYDAYLNTMYENIRDFDDYDTLGHMDYICRKAPYDDPFLHFEDFREKIDPVFMLLAERGKSLEINTRLFGKKEAVKEMEILCRRFAQLGGKTVTIGSDAHGAAGVGNYLENAYKLADRCGLTPVVYKERKEQAIDSL